MLTKYKPDPTTLWEIMWAQCKTLICIQPSPPNSLDRLKAKPAIKRSLITALIVVNQAGHRDVWILNSYCSATPLSYPLLQASASANKLQKLFS